AADESLAQRRVARGHEDLVRQRLLLAHVRDGLRDAARALRGAVGRAARRDGLTTGPPCPSWSAS
ncbi:MAG: hypothetical protein ACOCX4_05735, partial [Planctomycetota bacterium]